MNSSSLIISDGSSHLTLYGQGTKVLNDLSVDCMVCQIASDSCAAGDGMTNENRIVCDCFRDNQNDKHFVTNCFVLLRSKISQKRFFVIMINLPAAMLATAWQSISPFLYRPFS